MVVVVVMVVVVTILTGGGGGVGELERSVYQMMKDNKY